MKYTYLGRTGLKVSRLCLGTMNFGQLTKEKEAFRIMDAAVDAGINFFDTANVYGGQAHSGRTEKIIGKWFALGGGRREKVVLATKVYNPDGGTYYGPNGTHGLSAYKIHRHLEASLKRLRTDHVELYQMHHIDLNAPWEELWEAFDTQLRQGKIDYVGSSNFAGWNLVQAQAEAQKRNMLGLVSEQHKYSLMCRLPELEVLPAAQACGIGVIAYSPLMAGTLGGAVKGKQGARRAREFIKKRRVDHKKQFDAYGKLCKDVGESEANVALAWLLANPALTAPILGVRTLQQLKESLRAVEISLDEAILERLDKIFPGPGGSAPAAYAW